MPFLFCFATDKSCECHAGVVAGRSHPTAQAGDDAEHGHHSAADKTDVDALRLGAGLEAGNSRNPGFQLAPGIRLALELAEFRWRDPEFMQPAVRKFRELGVEASIALRIPIRQRLQQHAIDNAEDSRAGANPHGQTGYRGGSETGRAAERAEGEADVGLEHGNLLNVEKPKNRPVVTKNLETDYATAGLFTSFSRPGGSM